MLCATMAEYMQRVGDPPTKFSFEECNLLSVVNESVVGTRSTVWRIITSVDQKENGKGNQRQDFQARKYVIKVEIE